MNIVSNSSTMQLIVKASEYVIVTDFVNEYTVNNAGRVVGVEPCQE